MNVKEINPLVLAFLGDSIYEVYIRRYLINLGISNVNDLQTKSIDYVSAKSQASILKTMMDNNFFDEEELDVIKRARNSKSKSHPKNCDIVTYKHATAFEAIIGYLSLVNQENRINEIMEYIFNEKAN